MVEWDKKLLLHRHLDELAADFITETGKLLSETSVLELMEWSHRRMGQPQVKVDMQGTINGELVIVRRVDNHMGIAQSLVDGREISFFHNEFIPETKHL